jgi:hypothetical protein
VFEGRAAVGYDHGHDAEEVFYLGLALAEGYVEGFVEGCPERIGEDGPDEEGFLRGIRRTRPSGWWLAKASRPTARSGRDGLQGSSPPRRACILRPGWWPHLRKGRRGPLE